MDGLDKSGEQDGVVMASYPRSGNTLLRGYIEKIMGLVTGSDTDTSHLLNRALLNAGLAGEGLCDKRVWVIKTHFPERYGGTKFGAERTILLVRNPLDCMLSLFNLIGTKTHDLSVSDDTYVKFSNAWDGYIKQEITVWSDFISWWLKSKIPVHIVRFEDILESPKDTLTSLMKFILCVPTIENTIIEQYIGLACKQAAPQVYKPRKGKINANLDKYGKAQLAALKELAEEQIEKMGYTDFFNKDCTEVKKNNWIKDHNEEML